GVLRDGAQSRGSVRLPDRSLREPQATDSRCGGAGQKRGEPTREGFRASREGKREAGRTDTGTDRWHRAVRVRGGKVARRYPGTQQRGGGTRRRDRQTRGQDTGTGRGGRTVPAGRGETRHGRREVRRQAG